MYTAQVSVEICDCDTHLNFILSGAFLLAEIQFFMCLQMWSKTWLAAFQVVGRGIDIKLLRSSKGLEALPYNSSTEKLSAPKCVSSHLKL